MYYFYVLKSQITNKAYYGITDDLKKRFYRHNKGLNKATRPDVPWDLVYYEAYMSKQLAESREKMIKHRGKAMSELKKRIGFDNSR